jgi:hypothetical protein
MRREGQPGFEGLMPKKGVFKWTGNETCQREDKKARKFGSTQSTEGEGEKGKWKVEMK